MSQSLEDLIRAAQHQQAEQAVHPQRVLAALPQCRARAVRRRRLVLAVAAAAVAAVVAVPAFALRQGTAPLPPSATPGPNASPDLSRPVPLRYSPGWLPEGFAEYSRIARLPSRLNRVWAAAPPKSPASISDLTGALSMSVRDAEDADVTEDAGGETVDINGVRGAYRAEEPSGVTWQLGGTSISIGTLKPMLSKDTLLRIARSMRPDPAVMEWPLTVRVPAGQPIIGRSVTGVSAGQWLATDTFGELAPNGHSAKLDASISVGTMTRATPGGTALRVAGRPARYVLSNASRTGRYLVVDLDGGLKLTVFSEKLGQPAIVALAEAVGTPKLGVVDWIGR